MNTSLNASLEHMPLNISDEIYVRRKEDSYKIDTGFGEFIYELLGLKNGNSHQHSVAFVEILKGCSSQAHIHPHSEESYVVLEGQGRLIIDGETRIIKPGDLAKIPVGKVHQIFNDQAENLKFYCICAPAWSPECSVPVSKEYLPPPQNTAKPIYVKRKEECEVINTGRGELIFELLGVHNGDAEQHSVALVEMEKNGASSPHWHPKAEESYLILEGKGKLVIDGKERNVVPGDLAKIPVGKVHQIFNDHAETLKFYVVCAPAWTPDCSELIIRV